MKRLRTLAGVAIGPVSLTTSCALIASVTGGDPMLVVELAALVVGAAWLVNIGRGWRRALTDAARLSAQSRFVTLDGHAVRLLNEAADPTAFVGGMLRPQIYVSPSLIDNLDPGELRGVLLHEQHHRRTLAPLRGLALESWQRALGWLPPAQPALAARLAALEIEADAAAVARGVDPAALASALLKFEASFPASASAFSARSEMRVGELVACGRGERTNRRLSVPVEWVAPTSVVLAIWVCHLVGA